jgi:hypothetical protein
MRRTLGLNPRSLTRGLLLNITGSLILSATQPSLAQPGQNHGSPQQASVAYCETVRNKDALVSVQYPDQSSNTDTCWIDYSKHHPAMSRTNCQHGFVIS